MSAVRLLCAPAGFGKSVLASQFAHEAATACRYVSFLPGEDAQAVYRRLMRLRGPASGDACLDAALDAVESSKPAAIVLDHADTTAESGREAVSQFIAALDSRIGLTLCMRSPDRLIDPGWLCDGTAEVLDARALAFTRDDVVAMCTDLCIAFEEDDVHRLLEETEGWPIVVTGSLRTAAAHRVPLRDAYRLWLRECGKAFADFIATQCARSAYGEQLLSAVCSGRAVTGNELDLWERSGLFTIAAAEGPKVLRPISAVLNAYAAQRSDDRAAISAKLLGGAQISIAGKDVKWVRRKDSLLFKYLLLKDTHAATRVELMQVFWPDRDLQIAAQGLRTTCSNIRHALRAVVGDRVDAYFGAEGDAVRVHAAVLSDIAEFLAHVNAARSGLARGSAARAAAHLEKACRLYRGDLLAGMPPCGFESLAAQLRSELAYALQMRRRPLELQEEEVAVSA